MFQKACSVIKESVYGIECITPIKGGRAVLSNATAFMVSPGVLVTCAHVAHIDGDPKKSLHQSFQVIRAPEIGLKMEIAQFIGEDVVSDVAFLKVSNPRSTKSVMVDPKIQNIGTSCGSLGFPLGCIDPKGNFWLDLRFQGAFISSYNTNSNFYEVDSLMYSGSSGSPGFTSDGHVIGMQSKSRTGWPTECERKDSNKGRPKEETERFAISIWVPIAQIIKIALQYKVVI